ncbi:DUF3883 domain-containing protein [Lysinibacillus sp. KU-BSD001]|uniref:protein NO VEIN domain-containing protein n=1 Tax=Lysinibacillus sp. KU-BSD001 TaxID=3141328 RepID=UPI0036E58900
MKHNQKLALIIAFYLSKYDREAVEKLGYKNFTEAFKRIGDILDVKPASIKQMREQFDPYFDNPRVGWYQRPLSRSRKDVMNQYGEYSEAALREVVKDIVNSLQLEEPVNSVYTEYILEDALEVKEVLVPYTTRGITGKAAEELFLELYREGQILSFSAPLEDTREHGTGYDFRMKEEPYFVFEVKGLYESEGGILFTDHEWKVAQTLGESYFVVLLSNLKDQAQIDIVHNPYQLLTPKMNVQVATQVSWYVSSSDFKN